ncbi:MAG TPA: DUF29 domain-containing protein [Rhizomicrobium sp.]|nr:DUF29 domain-containing protein [Rhizomicrobium sp.]
MPPQSTYDTDFYCWTQEMARRLRERDSSSLDWENIAEEIESMGKRDYRALRSRMEVLLAHLLKWRYQPERRSRGWAGTIETQRRRIALIVADSPSFRGRIAKEMREAYAHAARRASIETAIPEKSFPDECPWTFETATGQPMEL